MAIPCHFPFASLLLAVLMHARVVRRRRQPTRTHTLWWNSALAIEAVRLGFDPASPWPLSGRMTHTAHAVRYASGEGGEVERAFDVVVVIVFDGSAQPLVVVDGAWRYRWNIATGTLARA